MIMYSDRDQKLVDKLISLGLKASNNGFQYILGAVRIYGFCETLKQGYIYNKVADIYSTTPSSVERCMRHEIEIFYNTVIDIPKELIPDPSTGKLTCKEFITRLTYILKKDGILQ